MTMNKLTLPSILVATIALAGIFAFMPVQEASTVHTTIIATSAKIVEVTGTCTIVANIATDCDNLHVSIEAGADFILLSMEVDQVIDPGGDSSADIGVLTVNGDVTLLNPALSDVAGTDPAGTDGAGVFGVGAGADTITAAITEGTGADLDAADTFTVKMYMLIESEAALPVLTVTGAA